MLISLRFRLSVIFIGLAIVPIVLVVIILTRNSNIYLERQSQTLLHEVTVSIGKEIRSFIEDHANHLFLIHKHNEFELLNLEKQRTILKNILFDQQVYQDLALLNPEGQELMRFSRSAIFFEKDLQNRAARKEFLVPATHKTQYFSAIHFDNKIQEPLITISVPLIDLRNGKLAYVLTGNLRFKNIWDLLASIKIPGEVLAYVVDQTNKVVAHPNPSVVLSDMIAILPEFTGRAKGLFGTDVIVSWDVLQLGDQKMTIVAEQPISQAMELITNHFRIAITITSLVIVIAIIFVMLAIRQIVRPVELLATAARAVSKGDYSQQVDVTSQDELGALESAFNEMSQDLAKYSNNMEKLVKIRTEELSQVNRQLEQSLKNVKKLSGLLPICASCKKVRDDKGYWNQIESYIVEHSEAEFSHGVCPECAEKLYSEFHNAEHRNKKD